MAWSFAGSDHAYVAAATSMSLTPPATPGLFYAWVFAFNGVAAGSGPWVKPWATGDPPNAIGPTHGWIQAGFQAPSGSGVGIEVWVAINGGSGPRQANFTGSFACQGAVGAWSGAYAPFGSINDGALRAATFAQVTGNTPASPSGNAVTGDLVIPCAADLMLTPGFGTPTGYTARIDAFDNGYGSAETAFADAVAAATGATGTITWPGNATTSGTLGTTATLLVKPAPTVLPSSGLYLDFTYPTV